MPPQDGFTVFSPSPISNDRLDFTIEHAIGDFARGPNGGRIVLTSGLAQIHRDVVIRLAAMYRRATMFHGAWTQPRDRSVARRHPRISTARSSGSDRAAQKS